MQEENFGTEFGTGTEVREGNTKPPSPNVPKKFKNDTQSRAWGFVINNYTEADVALMLGWGEIAKEIVASKEIAETGTPHIQGWIKFEAPKRFSKLKKMHSRANWYKAKSKNAGIYCCKEGSDLIVCKKSMGAQGERADMDSIREQILEGVPEKQLWDEHFGSMVRYHKGINESKKWLCPKRKRGKFELCEFEWKNLELKKSTIIWGETGIGKTQFGLAHFENPLWVRHMDMLKDLTPDHDGIVFDDMAFNHLPRSTQIFLTDMDDDAHIHIRYTVAIIPSGMRRIFTCNNINGEIFDLNDPAIKRRLEIVELNKQSFM